MYDGEDDGTMSDVVDGRRQRRYRRGDGPPPAYGYPPQGGPPPGYPPQGPPPGYPPSGYAGGPPPPGYPPRGGGNGPQAGYQGGGYGGPPPPGYPPRGGGNGPQAGYQGGGYGGPPPPGYPPQGGPPGYPPRGGPPPGYPPQGSQGPGGGMPPRGPGQNTGPWYPGQQGPGAPQDGPPGGPPGGMPPGGTTDTRSAWERYGHKDIDAAKGVKRGSAGTMTGFNEAGWENGERGSSSTKNTFGKIASRYPNKPSSLAAIVADPDFQAHFPNARIVKGGAGDKIDFGDGPVDVLKNADPTKDTADAWAWQPDNDPAGPGGDASAPNVGPDGLPRWGAAREPGQEDYNFGSKPGGPGMNEWGYRNFAQRQRRPYRPPTMGDFVGQPAPPEEQPMP